MTKLPKIPPTTRGPLLETYKNQLVLTPRQREIIIGTMLGDASLQTQDKGKTYRLKFEQGLCHYPYIKHLYEEFTSWCLSPLAKKERINANSNSVVTFAFQTLSHKDLKEFADIFLNARGKKKVIKPNLVQDYLTEVGLAYWFMDDGGKLDYTPNLGKGIVLHTQGFSKGEVIELSEGLKKKFNLQTKATKMKGKYVVSISGHSFV
jgi:hypothetical protein